MVNSVDILNQLTSAVITLNADLHISFLNDAAEALCRHSREYCLDQTIDTLFTELPFGNSMLEDCLRNFQAITLREVVIRPLGSQNEVHVNLAISPLNSHELLLEFEPIDRILRISLEDNLRSAQAVSQTFLRGLAHELGNPLGGIRGAAQLLHELLEERDHREYTQIILNETDRLRLLVSRMLIPSHSNQHEDFNIHEVLEQVLKVLIGDDALDFQRFSVVRHYDPSVPEIHGNKNQIIQALLNVVKNAAEALVDIDEPALTIRTGVTHQFTIGATRHPIVLQVEIQDNGPGIAPGLLSQVFFPMITTKVKGSGLGLAITQTIVGRHHGIVSCSSRPGKTSFLITLPVIHPKPDSH